MRGFFNKSLRINLTKKCFQEEYIPDSVYEKYLGELPAAAGKSAGHYSCQGAHRGVGHDNVKKGEGNNACQPGEKQEKELHGPGKKADFKKLLGDKIALQGR